MNTKDDILKNLQIIEECFEEAPVDFLGTNGIGATPEKDEQEWRSKYEIAIKNIKNLL